MSLPGSIQIYFYSVFISLFSLAFSLNHVLTLSLHHASLPTDTISFCLLISCYLHAFFISSSMPYIFYLPLCLTSFIFLYALHLLSSSMPYIFYLPLCLTSFVFLYALHLLSSSMPCIFSLPLCLASFLFFLSTNLTPQ